LCVLALFIASGLFAESVIFSEYDLPQIQTSLRDKAHLGSVREYRNLATIECEIFNRNGFLTEEIGSISLADMTKDNNVRILYAYDENNRLTQIAWNSNKIVYKYAAKPDNEPSADESPKNISREIMEEEHYTQDGLDLKIFYIYADGKLSEKRVYKGTGDFLHSYVFRYNTRGDVEEISKRTSRPDSEIVISSNFMEYYYEYDTQGRLALRAWGSGGSANKTKATVETFSYNDEGKLAGSSRGAYEANISAYKNDKLSAADAAVVPEKLTWLTEVTRRQYAPNGKTLEVTTHENSRHTNRYREKWLYEYDESGSLIKESWFENGVQLREKIYTLDMYGNPARAREYVYKDAFGAVTRSLARETQFAYTYY
jgi:antitoxin component YwqK of YwqJK toxin-antitoxin module